MMKESGQFLCLKWKQITVQIMTISAVYFRISFHPITFEYCLAHLAFNGHKCSHKTKMFTLMKFCPKIFFALSCFQFVIDGFMCREHLLGQQF